MKTKNSFLRLYWINIRKIVDYVYVVSVLLILLRMSITFFLGNSTQRVMSIGFASIALLLAALIMTSIEKAEEYDW